MSGHTDAEAAHWVIVSSVARGDAGVIHDRFHRERGFRRALTEAALGSFCLATGSAAGLSHLTRHREVQMDAHGQTTDKLKSYVERLERLLDEVDALKDSIKDLRTEIKNDGFNVKAVERIVGFRRKDGTADKEAEFINDVILYASVTGTPLDIATPEEGDSQEGNKSDPAA